MTHPLLCHHRARPRRFDAFGGAAPLRRVLPLLIALAPAAGAAAQVEPARVPMHVQPTGPITATEYADGQQRTYQTETRWRPACGSTPGALTADDLRRIAEDHDRQMGRADEVIVIDQSPAGLRGAGLNIVFNINASGAPAGFATAFTRAETYLESRFSDPVTVTISVSWANMGSGVIGATGSSYVTNVSWTSSRNGLINGMDGDDTIQNFLPAGSTIPVRFTATSAAVTNVSAIDWTRANFKATVGSVSGTDCSMQFNNAFSFDFDPSNGVGFNQISLVDVIIHEVGHGLGFVSAVDSPGTSLQALDIFRFARVDRAGIGNTNPDTPAQFQTTPREVDFNNPTNDDANSDLIAGEYRMSDGSPYQASHLFQQSPNPPSALGIMQPAFADGVTFGPEYFRPADAAVLDAIGWSRPVAGCPADADGNGQIQPSDVAMFVGTWFSSITAGTLAGDFDGDGAVLPSDVAAFVQVWFAAVNNGGC